LGTGEDCGEDWTASGEDCGEEFLDDPDVRLSLSRDLAWRREPTRLCGRRRGLTETDAEAFVFTDGKGGPLHYSNWRMRVWLPACTAAGIQGAGFHDLRRANATVMIAEGVDVKTAQQRLGHSDVRMTLGLYARVIESADRSASDVLASRFLGSGAPNSGNPRDGRAIVAQKGGTRRSQRRRRKRH
jgi:hypothetical protein